MPRIESRVSVTLPNSLSADRRADAGSSPRSTRSWMLRARWPRISASRSSSCGRTSVLGRGRIHDASDRVDQLRPAILLARELRLAGGGQLVILRALVGFADVPFGLEPAPFLEAMKRRIERTGLDFEQ